MAYETIIVEISENVALVRLNRPESLNALNSQLLGELTDALTDADNNDKVRVIVLAGCDKAFAAGADIKEMATRSFVDVATNELFVKESQKIAAVQTHHCGSRRVCTGWWLRNCDDVRFYYCS